MRLLVFLQTDCPTCQLIVPYLNTAASQGISVRGLSQDDESATRAFVAATGIRFPVDVDRELRLSQRYDPLAVPALVLLDDEHRVLQLHVGFDKTALNAVVATMGLPALASDDDGAPASKPGCTSRHREASIAGASAPFLDLYTAHGAAATRLNVPDEEDLDEYCARTFGDPLPVVPPTEARVARMLAASPWHPHEVIGRIPPNYGAATVEKIAANAVMAGCPPGMMRVLVPLVRAACDERFNLHGVQATTHFAAPLIIVNGLVRHELGFWCRQNVFSNVARANSTLGRAFQLLIVNLGGARPHEIDMSTLGNPGKFSYCIAENEEENPWASLAADRGLPAASSAVTLFAGEPPHGVSEHTARTAPVLAKALSAALATAWSHRSCVGREAVVVLCPEHVKTIHRDGWSKEQLRQFLFDHTGIPVRAYRDHDGGEGTHQAASYAEVVIDGEPCYRKFSSPSAIHLVVAGGTAGKFSAVIGGWSAGPRGSQMVTYPV
ncbi:MAG TPA: TlpA disulfide reductase family protein [Vicinamibacterales bacterium]|nr:TlpA disulfide reductase family protein [Vicinamibacterales bacterium]